MKFKLRYPKRKRLDVAPVAMFNKQNVALGRQYTRGNVQCRTMHPFSQMPIDDAWPMPLLWFLVFCAGCWRTIQQQQKSLVCTLPPSAFVYNREESKTTPQPLPTQFHLDHLA